MADVRLFLAYILTLYAVTHGAHASSPPPPSPGSGACPAFSLADNTTSVVCEWITIPPGGVLSAGTCSAALSACTGDTVITLVDESHSPIYESIDYETPVLVSNDDGLPSGCGSCSYLQYANPTYTPLVVGVQQSCFDASACTGTTGWSTTQAPAPPPPPSPPPPPGPPPPVPSSVTTCSVFMSESANYADCSVTVQPGGTVLAGTCGVSGAYCFGDTEIQLLNASAPTTSVVAENDDGAPSGCDMCSHLSYVNTGETTDFTLRVYCVGNSSCTGAPTWEVLSPSPPPPSPPHPPPPHPPPR